MLVDACIEASVYQCWGAQRSEVFIIHGTSVTLCALARLHLTTPIVYQQIYIYNFSSNQQSSDTLLVEKMALVEYFRLILANQQINRFLTHIRYLAK